MKFCSQIDASREGRYLIQNVPPKTYAVATQYLGYTEARQNNVEIQAGATATVDFQIAQTVLTLEDIVVMGTTDPLAGIKSPLSIGKVSRERILRPCPP